MKRNMKLKSPMMSKSLISGAIVFFVAFFAAFISSSVLTPTRVSDATNLMTTNVAFTGYYVKLNSSDVTMELLTTPTGTMTVASSTVKTVTNSPNGYKLYLSMSSEDISGNEKSFNDKLKNGLYLDGDLSRTDGMLFNAASGKGGSTASASLAPLTDNTWGYAVDKNSTGAPTIWQNEDHSTMSSATPTNDKFAAVPKATEVDLIQETTSSNVAYDTPESEVQDSDFTDANLYYGIRGRANLEAGSYMNTIAYTAVGKTEPSGTLAFNPSTYIFSVPYESMTWTDTVTIQTPLYTSAEDLGTATVTLSGGPDNVSGLACSNPTLAVQNNLLTVTCTLPQAHAGNYDVLVYLDKYGQIYTGNYTYEDPYSASYTVAMNKSNVDTNVDSLSIPYGGIGYVEVTPTAGYLSSVVCPQGYTCSGYNTGSFATEKQTIAITNNNTTAGGTLVLVGVNKTLSQITKMQEMGPGICNASSIDESATLTDIRDNNTYTVKKLKDGRCWMTQNLNLQGPITLTSGDSNVSSNWVLPTTTTAYYSSGDTVTVDSNGGSADTITDKWCNIDYSQQCMDQIVNMYTGNAAYGAYYTWRAATVGTGDYSMTSGNTSSSVCPKGWRLPTSGSDGEFKTLSTNYPVTGSGADNQMLNGDPHFVLSGYRSGGQSVQGWGGDYWSSTVNNSNISTYSLNVGSSTVDPAHGDAKFAGFTVRCIAQ